MLHLAEFKPTQASRKIVTIKSVESGSKNLEETCPHETGLSRSQALEKMPEELVNESQEKARYWKRHFISILGFQM